MIRTLTYGFWIASILEATIVCLYIYKKKLYREFPIFFAFLTAETSSDIINLGLSFGSYKLYFYVSWIGVAVTTALSFAVLHELFRHIFRPYENLRNFGTTLFRWASVVLLLIGVIMALTSSPIATSPIANFVLTIDRSVRIMQCALVLFMYLFSRQLGLTERHRVFGVAIGFGLTASLHLIVVTYMSIAPSSGISYVLNVLHQFAYVVSVGIWGLYMYRPEPERRRTSLLEQSESWNYALAAVTNDNGGAAFLPNVVDTVEKVLTKRATSITSEFRPR
jgi:hypothetical protein